jgi:hypothetical protein
VTLTASNLPPGAAFFDNGNNTATFTWTPLEGQAGTYTIAVVGRNSRGDVETAYSRIVVIALPPVNDDFWSAIHIGEIPHMRTQLTTLATQAYDDPFCGGAGRTVWYAFTPPTDMRIEANTFGSDFDTTLSVYTGPRGALNQVACNDNAADGRQSRVRFNAIAGVTYYFMAGSYHYGSGGHLVFNLLPAPPPLTIGLALTSFGGIVPASGEATAVGSLLCSRPVVVTITGDLKQDRGQSDIIGHFAAVVACNESTDWTAAVVVPVTLYQGRAAALLTAGNAVITATASAVDDDNGETIQSHAAADVLLRAIRQ